MRASAESSKIAQVARAAACALVGPSGLFIAPTLAIASKWLEEPIAHSIPAAGAIIAVLAGVSEHLTAEATRHVISSLKEEGNHDLELLLANSIRAALQEAQRELTGDKIFAEHFDDWFSLWHARLDRARRNPVDAALLFQADDTVDPVVFATISNEQWWPKFRVVLLRWATEEHEFSKANPLPSPLPIALDQFLSEHLLEFAQRAQRLELRENERAWKAWQHRFFEALAESLQQLVQSVGRIEALLVEIRAWLAETRAAKMTPPAMGSVPPPPGLFIGREEVVADLRRRLLPAVNNSAGRVQLLTAVRGWPGVGKTTVAAALAHDQALTAAFPDGLLWASLGQNPNLIGQLDIWVRELGSALLEREDAVLASRQLASILREKCMLLIVDDVWTIDAARPFVVGGIHCSTIITTRLTNIAEALAPTPGQVYPLDVLTEEKSLELLGELAPDVVKSLPDECRLLARELEGLPLALQVAGRLIQSEWYRGFSVEQLLNDLRNAAILARTAPPAPDGSPSATVSALFKKSTDVLSDELRYWFASLGWFAPKPATFTVTAMRDVWRVEDPTRIAAQLIDHGLLEPAGPERYQMHALLILHAKSLLDD